jgi:Protein of unknown function (DUF2987)
MIRNIRTFSIKSFSLATICVLTSLSGGAAAGVETSFTYSGLYKSLKTASANDYSQIALNFYLFENGKSNDQVCPIEGGYISDGDKKIDLTMNERGQMLLPLDKSLKQDRAAITISTAEKNMCHLSMRIEVASFELVNTSLISVNGWIDQISELFAELAGWPGRYFMPELTGLNFKLANTGHQSVYFVDAEHRQLLKTTESDNIYLSRSVIEKLSQTGNLEFSDTLLAVTPQLAN